MRDIELFWSYMTERCRRVPNGRVKIKTAKLFFRTESSGKGELRPIGRAIRMIDLAQRVIWLWWSVCVQVCEEEEEGFGKSCQGRALGPLGKLGSWWRTL